MVLGRALLDALGETEEHADRLVLPEAYQYLAEWVEEDAEAG